jgi:chromosome segregation ATPase
MRKLGIVALAVIAGAIILNTTRVGSYTSTLWSKARTKIKKQVPLEFEIERVRDQLAKLGPATKKNLDGLAQEIVAIESLKKDIAVTQENLVKQRHIIRSMTQDLRNLKEGTTYIVYDGRRYSVGRVKDQLSKDVESARQCEEGLKTKEALLEAREANLDAARAQLEAMRVQKDQLEVRLAQLEVELKNLRVAQTRSKFQIDDSCLGQIKESLAEIEKAIQVEKVKNDLVGEFGNDVIPVDKKAKSTDEVIRDAEAYLGVAPKEVAGNK